MTLKVCKTWWAPNLLALALAIGLAPCLSAHPAQSQSSPPQAQQQPGQDSQDQQTKTFVGQVIQAQDGRFALLTDKSSGRGYFLDNQSKAKKYNGKTVKITGTVDNQTKTLHIEEIQPM